MSPEVGGHGEAVYGLITPGNKLILEMECMMGKQFMNGRRAIKWTPEQDIDEPYMIQRY